MKQIASGASQTRSYFLACESWKMKPACCNVIWYTSWCVPLEGYAAFFRIFEQKFKDLCWRSVLPGHIWSFRMRTVTFPGCNLYPPKIKIKKIELWKTHRGFFPLLEPTKKSTKKAPGHKSPAGVSLPGYAKAYPRSIPRYCLAQGFPVESKW